MTLFPLASFRDSMNGVPEANGRKLTPMAVMSIFSREITIAVELEGMIAKDVGVVRGGEAKSVKGSSNGEHC